MSLGLLGSSQTAGASPLLQAAPFVNCRKSSVVSVSQTLWVVSLLQGQEDRGCAVPMPAYCMCCSLLGLGWPLATRAAQWAWFLQHEPHGHC